MPPPTESEFNFSAWLEELGHGATNARAGKLLREIVGACETTGKTGKLVLTLTVGAVGGLAEVRPTLKITKPDPALPGGSYFATEHGDLVTEDPRQGKLPLKAIPLAPLRKLNRDDDEGGVS